MILAAALLVLVGLGLFVGGFLTGETVLYWACVAACVAAGIFLLLARRRMGRAPAAPAPPGTTSPFRQHPASAGTDAGPTAAGATPVGAATGGDRGSADPVADRADAAPPTRTPAGTAPEPAPDAVPAWERTARRGWETAAAPVGDPAAPPVAEPPPTGLSSAGRPDRPSTAAHAPRGSSGAADQAGDPPVEEVEVTDLLVVVDLRDEVLVVDEHPRYHLGGCRWLAGRETIPLPVDEARTDGFTPCAWCEPDRTLAERERSRRSGRGA